jgi:hypothetical protein
MIATLAASLLVPCALAFASVQGDEHVLVDKKRVAELVYEGAPWQLAKGGGLQGSGAANRACTSFEVGAGDWDVHLRLEIAEQGDTECGFAFAEDAFLGLDGRGKKLYVDGKRFGSTFFEFGDATRAWKPGEPFALDIERRGTKLRFALDSKPLSELEFHANAVGKLSVRPGRTTVKILEWRVAVSLAQRRDSADVVALREPIERAIARGVLFLLSTQQRDGSWSSGQPQYVCGQTALSTYALLKSGLAPTEPAVVRAFRFLDAHPPYDTYSSGLVLMAYEAAHEPKYRERMRPLVRALLANQRQGMWSYPTGFDGRRWDSNQGNLDLSNTQYAVLGLRAANALGIEVPPKTWIDLIENVLRLQEPPSTIDVALAAGETGVEKRSLAGFRYNVDAPAKGSMTAAGVSALAIARDALGPKLAGAQSSGVAKGIQLGLAWLGQNFRADVHPGGEEPWLFYWLYGAERVGSLLDVERFGEHDWYLEGARFLLQRQGASGEWASNAGGVVRAQETDTCYALLFLERATAKKLSTGGAEASFFEPPPQSKDDVRFAWSGRGSFEFWIGGISDRAIAEHGGGEIGGLRVAYVEYVTGNRVLARVEGEPSRAWSNDRFRAKLDLLYPGVYPVVARVYLVAPNAPRESTEATRSIQSPAVDVRSFGATVAWMDELVPRRERNLLAGKELTLTASSSNGDDQPWRAFDGLEGSRWMCKNDDPAPTMVIELPKPAPATELVLYSHCASPKLRGEHDVIRRVSVRVNRNKDLIEAVASDDELAPISVPLGKTTAVQRLEIRILDRTPGRARPGFAGFTEIELYK